MDTMRFVGRFLRRFLKGILIFLQLALPWIWEAVKTAIELIGLSFVTYYRGARDTTREVATEWKIKAVQGGFPQNWQKKLYYVIYFVVVVLNILGLILLSHLVVIVVWWIF